mmetsp:Transcript_5426/g.22494  ORF Transcript_5426/g.22494 Transcript_5426/m.22494 type:complete len:273 (-) Transcript_5426:171-989(-)
MMECFAVRGTLAEEHDRFKTLVETRPEVAAAEMRRGAMLVAYARDGDLENLDKALAVVREGGDTVLFWFACQMAQEAASRGRVEVLRYMHERGLRIVDQPPLDELLTHVAETHDHVSDDAVAVTTFLVREVGVVASKQRRADWLSALHIACRRGTFELAEALVSLGADVNAVARDDVMPLHCVDAYGAAAPEDSATAERLRRLLEDRGARRTWRRDVSPVVSATTPQRKSPPTTIEEEEKQEEQEVSSADEEVDSPESSPRGGLVFGTEVQQ